MNFLSLVLLHFLFPLSNNQPTYPTTNLPTNLYTYQPTYQPPDNQSTNQPIYQPTNLPTNPYTYQPTCQPTCALDLWWEKHTFAKYDLNKFW